VDDSRPKLPGFLPGLPSCLTRLVQHAALAEGERFTVSYDGKTLFGVTDTTFAEAGGVALWTKADSVTRFDRLTITPLR